MNDLFTLLGIEGWKPIFSALVLPPLPLLLLALAGGALLSRKRRRMGWTLLLGGVVGGYALSLSVVANALVEGLTRPPPPLSASAVTELARLPKTAIVVLGAGRRLLAPEYGVSDLTPMSLERLRYGAWLARQSGLPLAFSGGVGHGAEPGATEAEIARRVASRDLGVRMRWTEEQSRDTNENAFRTVALLRDQGIERIVLVTHDFHMRRALAGFERALRRDKATLALVAAPMGQKPSRSLDLGDWLPSPDALLRSRIALHEWLGYLGGA